VRVVKNSGLVLSRLCTKFHEIWGQSRRPFVLFCAFVRLSMSGFVQKIFAIKSRIIKSSKNRTNVGLKVLAHNFFSGGMTPTFLRQSVNAIYCSAPFGKSLSSVCWCSSPKLGNEVECGNYVGLVQCRYNLKPFVDQNSCRFGTM